MAVSKYLKYEYYRNGKPTGRVQEVLNPSVYDQRAQKGIPFKRAQQLVNALEASSKWERVGNNVPVAEGNSTRVQQAAAAERRAQAELDREHRAHLSTAEAIAKAVKES